jgi:predicted dehydrogenase
MVNIAQLGCGYWGPNLLRNFSALPQVRVKWVVDSSAERRAFVEANFPNSKTCTDFDTVLHDPEVSAVVIATPAATHADLVEKFLNAGKHVFVEKPLATTTADADRLVALAAARHKVLLVGHTFLYNPAVRYIRNLIDSGDIGEIYYCYSQRLNLGQLRHDVNAWWNLAPHDVSILLYLMNGQMPASVSAWGVDYLQPGIEDVTFATLEWATRVTGTIHVSWLDPNKVRRVTVVGSRKMVVYDDVSENTITIYNKGFEKITREGLPFDQPAHAWKPQHGDITIPAFRREEPLRVECAHFIDCILNGTEPLTGGRHARDTVAVMEAVDRSQRNRGQRVECAAPASITT